MKEDKSSLISKKIRNKLIYYTYLDIKKSQVRKNYLLINSMSSDELNDKYQKCSDYCVKKSEIYTSNEVHNGINNNNFFYVSVTYRSKNNYYHIMIDTKNVEQYIGSNNLEKYYKGETIQIESKINKNKYNISLDENNLEKKVIGEKKLMKKQHRNNSSLEITKNIHIIDNENNNELNDDLDNLKSNNNHENYKKLIKNNNINIEEIQANNRNKIRKLNTQKIFNKYMIKLKKYCSKLIKIERKKLAKNNYLNNKIKEPSLSTNDKKIKNRNDKKIFRSGKEKPKIIRIPILKRNESTNINYENNSLNSKNVIDNSIHSKIKSQTKINQNAFKIQTRSSFRRNRSIDKREEESFSPQKSKKKFTPKKPSPQKKINSPKKKSIYEFNSGPTIPISKFGNVYQKFNKKEPIIDSYIKKYTSGNKVEYPSNRRKINTNIVNGYFKVNTLNEKVNISSFRGSNNVVKKDKFKKSLTIKKMYKFRAGELLEKKINNIKIKEK